MILTKSEILKLISKKKVVVSPFDPNSVGPASIDLTLGDTIWVFDKKKAPVLLDDSIDYTKHAMEKKISKSKGYDLKPGEFVLGVTFEKITLPLDVCAWVNSRSRFARFGLMSHSTAPFIQPGVSNHTVLEIKNLGTKTLTLVLGVKICQLILEKCKGKAKYVGRFRDQ